MPEKIWAKIGEHMYKCRKCGQTLEYGGEKTFPPIGCPGCVLKARKDKEKETCTRRIL